MTILAGDIQILATQVMDDVPEGGGAATGTVIADGASNGIFSDISELDRTYGNVSLRKIVAAVRSIGDEAYYGAMALVAKTPSDPRVSCSLFSTGDAFDVRSSAKNRVEAYLARGARWPGWLLETHIEGQRAITIWQRTGLEIPVPGQTLSLVYGEGTGNEAEQYVRITRIVSTTTRTFTDSEKGDYMRTVWVAEISDPLTRDFPGYPVTMVDPATSESRTTVRDTLVADAAQYYGAANLSGTAAIGDVALDVDTIYTQLVPSAQTETAITDARPNGQVAVLSAAGGAVSVTLGPIPLTAGQAVYAGGAVAPGSLSIAAGAVTLTDRGGMLYDGATAVGRINYPNGIVTMAGTSPGYGSASKTLSFTPAGAATVATDSLAIPVTSASRSLTYATTFDPVPAPGTLTVSFLAGGQWYSLTDDGSGALRGSDASYGAGVLSQATGSMSLTLGALPDVGSSILLLWGSKAEMASAASAFEQAPGFEIDFGAPIKPGTVSISGPNGWAAGDASGVGALSGSATGTIDYKTGTVNVVPNTLPAPGDTFTATALQVQNSYVYQAQPVVTLSGGNAAGLLGSTPVQPGTVHLGLAMYETVSGYQRAMYLQDDGAGNLLGTVYEGSGKKLSVTRGTIDYTTGAFAIPAAFTQTVYAVPRAVSSTVAGVPRVAVVYEDKTTAFEIRNNTTTTASYMQNAAPGATLTKAITPTALSAKLTLPGDRRILAGSLSFSWSGMRISAQTDNTLTTTNPATGATTQVGALNPATGVLSISTLGTAGAANSLNAINDSRAIVLVNADLYVSKLAFRTPAAPLRSASMTVVAQTAAGAVLTGTATAAGTFSGTGVTGTIDTSTGIASVSFGAQVLADTIRYSAVAFSYLPLSSTVLGLDPVRLPSDGRVPIFKPGRVIVVHHTATTSAATLSAGQTIDVGRTRLARVRLIGADGLTISSGYTPDLDAGQVTINSVTGWVQPVKIAHTIQDLALLSDAQISGRLAFSPSLTHDYPAGSIVSSALILGNLRARVSLTFDQGTWSGGFSDAPSGSTSAASFDETNHPITVTNDGAVTERWACVFTSTTGYKVIGEHLGQVTTGDVNTNCTPLNPTTGRPYFTIPAAGWGGGWAAGNVLRINTVAAQAPIWGARTVQQGPSSSATDETEIWILGGIDRP